jgi:hypothetical protein
VTSDPYIFRAVELMIDQHGNDAPLRAAERANQLLDAGDAKLRLSSTIASEASW